MKEWLRGIDPKLARRWAAIGVAGIILILMASIFTQGTPKAETAPPQASESPGPSGSDALLGYEATLDQEVARSLSAVAGAGRVQVSITLSGSPTKRFAQNTQTQTGTTRQKDAQGGSETQTTDQTSRSLASGGSASAVLTQEVGPKVVGVLVVAKGADDPLVRDDLFQATTTLLGIPGYKVMVLP